MAIVEVQCWSGSKRWINTDHILWLEDSSSPSKPTERVTEIKFAIPDRYGRCSLSLMVVGSPEENAHLFNCANS